MLGPERNQGDVTPTTRKGGQNKRKAIETAKEGKKKKGGGMPRTWQKVKVLEILLMCTSERPSSKGLYQNKQRGNKNLEKPSIGVVTHGMKASQKAPRGRRRR